MASFTGFFSQQLVQFQDCLQHDASALTSISRTNSYTRSGGTPDNWNHLDYTPMMAAINFGVLQPVGDLTKTYSSGCISSNCTFSEAGEPAFSTLEFSHSCSDITSQIRIINQTVDDSNRTFASLGLDYGYEKSFTFAWQKVDPTGLSTFTNMNVMSSAKEIFFVFRTDALNYDWKALNCTISPTINTYAARINNAELEETFIDKVSLRTLGAQFKEPSIDRQDWNYTEKQSEYSHLMTTDYAMRDGTRVTCEGSDTPAPGLTLVMKSSNESTYVNVTGSTNPSAGWKWWYYPNECVWSIHVRADLTIGKSLSDVFNAKKVGMGMGIDPTGSVQVRVLYEEGNITFSTVDKRIKNLAAAMTTVVRTHGGNYWTTNHLTQSVPEISKGKVWVNTTCVAVRWKWIAFPAIMIGMTGVFLLLVAFENRGFKNDRLWKSSFLAALFCDVEIHEIPVGKEEMSAVAKSTSVSLDGKSGRLRLVTA
jgi:hypothetical protein